MSKKLIYFNQNEFHKQQKQYKETTKLETEILKELNNFLPTKVKDLDNYKDALNVLYKALEHTPANTMGLSGDVIADLRKLDLTRLKQLVKKYEPMKAPVLSEFSIYATEPEQIERLNAFTELLKAYDKICELDKSLKPAQIANAIPYRCRFEHETQMLRPNPDYILTGTYKIYG